MRGAGAEVCDASDEGERGCWSSPRCSRPGTRFRPPAAATATSTWRSIAASTQVRQMKDPAYLENAWAAIAPHVKIGKIYLETHRDTIVVDQSTLDQAKRFFEGKGLKVAGGITITINESNQFETYCYSNPDHRRRLQEVVELTARNFDEVILDDFFFTSCKCDLCVRAKGAKSWTAFRLALMDEAGRELVMKPARAVNPKVKVTIKYPKLVRAFPGAWLQPRHPAEVLRQGVHRHRDARRRLQQPAPAAVPRVFDLPVLREHQARGQRRRLGRHRGAALPRPLRRTAVADPFRESAGDYAVRHPAAVSANPPGGREHRARVRVRAAGRVRIRAGGQLRGAARHAGRRQDVQAVSLVGRRSPRELSRHDRRADGYRAGVPSRGPDRPADRGGRPRFGHRDEDQDAVAGRQERGHHVGTAEGARQGPRRHRRAASTPAGRWRRASSSAAG